MTTGAPGGRRDRRLVPVRWSRTEGTDEHHRVTTFELFFDLVFVFAFTQTSALVAESHDGLGVVRGATILGLLWWSWCAYSWLANQARADRGATLLGMTVALAALFVLGLVIPGAYDAPGDGLDAAVVLIVAYAVVRLVHGSIYLVAAGADRDLRRQVVRSMAIGALPSIAILCVGAWVGEPAQTWVWLGAWVVDALVVFVTSQGGDWRLPSPGHFCERYGLVVILALGESVVAIGAGVAQVPLESAVLVAVIVAIVGAVGVWALYFLQVAPAAEHALGRRRGLDLVRTAANGFTYLHYPIVLGIVLMAIGVEESVHHVPSSDHALGFFGGATLGAGLALFLVGTAGFDRLITGSWRSSRLVAAVVLALGLPALATVAPALLVLVVALVPVGAVLVIEDRAAHAGAVAA